MDELKLTHELPEYIQYPIDEVTEDMPGRPIQNIVLAESMAYAEDPYRDLARRATDLGLGDIGLTLLRHAKKNSNLVETTYYQDFGVNKRTAKVIRNETLFQQMALRDNLPEAEALEYEYSLQQLNDIRGAVRVFSEMSDHYSLGSGATISRKAPLRKAVEMNEVMMQHSITGSPLVSRYRWKVENVLKLLFKSAAMRRTISLREFANSKYLTAPESLSEVYPSVTGEVRQLAESLERMRVDGQLSTKGVNRIFGQFDLSKYSFAQFQELTPLLEPDGSNIVELSNQFNIPPEEYDAMAKAHVKSEQEKIQHKEEINRQKQLEKAQAEMARVISRINSLQSSEVFSEK